MQKAPYRQVQQGTPLSSLILPGLDHPNEAGYRIIAEELMGCFDQISLIKLFCVANFSIFSGEARQHFQLSIVLYHRSTTLMMFALISLKGCKARRS